jgi:beta-N-acetylhexosaminidase
LWRMALLSCIVSLVSFPAFAQNIDVQIARMSTADKVGQLMLVGFAGTDLTPEMRRWVQERHVGGVVLFSRNMTSFSQTATLTRKLHACATTPLFVALDQEGGSVARIKEGAISLPGNMALGATRDPALAYVAGQALAIDLRLLGFNMNLAPVLDVNSNPRNPVIGVRSYGEDPKLVGTLGAWYVRGQQEMGVVAVAKHFPGHGNAASDSHFGLPQVVVSKKHFEKVELVPFKQAIAAGLDAIMTAHIAFPNIAEAKNTPATLSHAVLTNILRRKLRFEGIVVTDGLEMQGVEKAGVGAAAVKAILAGADMPMVLWTAQAREQVYRALLAAVRSGEISATRLDQSVRRILSVKQRRGLFDEPLEPLAEVVKHHNNALHDRVSETIAQQSITLVRNRADVLPVRLSRYRKVVVLAPQGEFAKLLQQPQIAVFTVPQVMREDQRKIVKAQMIAFAQDADLILFAVQNRYHIDIAKDVFKALPQIPSAVVSLGSPYYLTLLPDVDAFVCSYGALAISQTAAAQAILGTVPMPGHLPISIPGFYPYGYREEENLTAGVFLPR